MYPVLLEERSTGTNLVLRINDEITLNLEESDVLAENLLFVTATVLRHDVETVNTSSIQARIYHDKNWRSSVMVRQKDGILHVEGVVNRKLRIKPVPEGERSAQGHVLHSLYEVRERGENLGTTEAYVPYHRRPQGNVQSQRWRPTVRRPGYYPVTQNSPTTSASNVRGEVRSFVVDVHMISDEEHNKNFRYREDLILYLGIMLNAVTLRYLEMQSPRIIFKIAGVTMSKLDSFESHILGTIEAHETLEKLEKYIDGNIPGDPDLAFLITGRELSSIRGGTLDKDIAGLANVAKVCTRRGVAMGEDNAPSFDGVFAMAHEIGHSLGARHDPRGRGECSSRLGYLMSYEDGGPNKYRLSPCSEEAIRTNTQKLPDKCIRELSTRVHPVPRPDVMPGQRISRDEFCRITVRRSIRQKRVRTDAYSEVPPDLTKECKMKCCYEANRNKWCLKVDLLDGMECAQGSTCRRGVCGRHNRAEK